MNENFPPPSFLRRLMVIFYDTMLLFSVLFFAGMLVYPLTHAQNSPIYSFYLFCVCFLYFGWQWTHGGQTLAMGTWRVRLQATDGQKVTWRQALIRFFVAIVSWLALGIGFFWALFDSKRRTWHDIASDTHLVKLQQVTEKKLQNE